MFVFLVKDPCISKDVRDAIVQYLLDTAKIDQKVAQGATKVITRNTAQARANALITVANQLSTATFIPEHEGL